MIKDRDVVHISWGWCVQELEGCKWKIKTMSTEKIGSLKTDGHGEVHHMFEKEVNHGGNRTVELLDLFRNDMSLHVLHEFF